MGAPLRSAKAMKRRSTFFIGIVVAAFCLTVASIVGGIDEFTSRPWVYLSPSHLIPNLTFSSVLFAGSHLLFSDILFFSQISSRIIDPKSLFPI